MSDHIINAKNVGRIAERIVANELEARGFKVSDLNKEGLAANADLLGVRDGTPWQIQVKGATNPEHEKWWIGYGHCSQKQIDNRAELFFNPRQNSFYSAQVVVLVAVCTPKDYRCIVLPIDVAETAVQLSIDADFRLPKRNGEPHKPGKTWCDLNPNKYEQDSQRCGLKKKERDLLLKYEEAWAAPFLATKSQGAGN
jgi:hypothetical protein